ncbi:MAG: UvrD-helicase domain-containing protein [Prevotella sp.]|nr:UvrD-helicase domain-containing protein [Prevotella sp.]
MSIFSWIFKSQSKEDDSEVFNSSELSRLMNFEDKLRRLLSTDKYIARRDYKPLCEDYVDIYHQFCTLKQSKTLDYYCSQNHIDIQRIEDFLSKFDDLSKNESAEVITIHNKEYLEKHLVSEKEYLDNILKRVDPAINLDDEQRRVVLSDEDYTLVIAGAGAGKTTTVAAKVKYLVEKKNVSPDQILVISFTNKAVGELRSKINKALKIDCPVTTFHKTGYAILRRKDEERKLIVDGGFMFNVISNYLKGNILENPELVDKLILFFGSYFDAPYEGDDLNTFFNYIAKADFSTLRGNMSEYTEEIINKRTGNKVTIARETLRSSQEVRIANFLYLNNIEYVYEKPYPFNILYSHKPYTPDFTITQGEKIAYIEHFGITEDGENNRYTLEELERYKKAVNDKVLLHRKHKTDLIFTFSRYNDGRDLLVHLNEQLIEHGFKLQERPAKEVFEKIVNTEENRYIANLVKLICTFIQNFKTNGYSFEKFDSFRYKSNNVRTKLFLDICEQCYHEYSKRLKEKNAIDFEDMINDSAKIIREQEISGKKLDFKYIIVDEYQDISRQRFNLTKELSNLCNAKIIAVGDDWQSIYAYAGSDITLFTHFKEAFGYGQELSITKTYRNAQEVIDIAGGFIQKNTSQKRKVLVSPKHIKSPVIIETYTEEVDRKQYEGKGGKYFLIGKTVENVVKHILQENPNSSILLLGRYGFDAYNLGRSSDFVYDEKTGNLYSKTFENKPIEFMTVHRAKGLGCDNVIIINARNEVYGFPSQVQEDPVLKFVVKDDHSIEYAEERRLFYVALTRTKNRVYIVAPKEHPSEFVIELLNDYSSNIVVHGDLVVDETMDNKIVKRCPICGYPLQLRFKKAYGLKLWICSNEPEICDFMTNNLKGGILPIMKCEKCRDGYMIVKEGKGLPFLGCTNYNTDGSGCNNMISRDNYVRLYGKNEIH